MEWPTSAACLRPAACDQRRRPVGHRRDAVERRSVGPAVGGKVDRQHAAAMMGEPARLQAPGRAVETARRAGR